MSKKKTTKDRGDQVVYSTDPGYNPGVDEGTEPETLQPRLQKLKIRLDTRMRAGKCVTLVEGFAGTSSDLEALGKKMKALCGTGGTVKDGCILIQGDQQDKLMIWLAKNGYASARKV
jgi:translation initiation factor 1